MVIEFVMESQSNKARTLDVLHVASRPTFEGEQSNLRFKKKNKFDYDESTQKPIYQE